MSARTSSTTPATAIMITTRKRTTRTTSPCRRRWCSPRSAARPIRPTLHSTRPSIHHTHRTQRTRQVYRLHCLRPRRFIHRAQRVQRRELPDARGTRARTPTRTRCRMPSLAPSRTKVRGLEQGCGSCLRWTMMVTQPAMKTPTATATRKTHTQRTSTASPTSPSLRPLSPSPRLQTTPKPPPSAHRQPHRRTRTRTQIRSGARQRRTRARRTTSRARRTRSSSSARPSCAPSGSSLLLFPPLDQDW